MRKIAICCTLLMSAGLAVGQMAPASGYAFDQTYGNQGPRLISTPSLSLDNPAPIVGASNATLGNVAGARNSTLAIVDSGDVKGESNSYRGFASQESASSTNGGTVVETANSESQSSFNLGIARFQSSEGVATLMADSGARHKAARAYTNEDIERLNQENGKVKAGDKVEQLN